MDKLIANASVGLAKAGMNRRGFLGRLARSHWRSCNTYCRSYRSRCRNGVCQQSLLGPYFCETHSDNYCGACGENCSPSSRPYVRTHHGVHCLSGERLPIMGPLMRAVVALFPTILALVNRVSWC